MTEGQELYVYGSDPTDPDTDGDGWNDGKEVSNYYDPLVFDEYHFTLLQRVAEGLVGFIAGEFLAEGHPTTEYFIGYMISGVIPGVGEIADVRDVLGSLFKNDPMGAVINAVGLVPLFGDAAKIVDKGIFFVEKCPKMKPAVDSFVYLFSKNINDLKRRMELNLLILSSENAAMIWSIIS